MQNYQKIIDETVKTAIVQLKKHQLLNDSRASSFQKVEKCLYCYSDFKEQNAGHGLTDKFIHNVEDALAQLEDDFYYDILRYKYFDKLTQEEIAEKLHCDVSTVTRNKNRLIKRLSFMLFSDQAIEELLFN